MVNLIMNRTQRMDNFLKYIASIAYYNPNLLINENMVYHQLIFYDIDEKDRDDNLNRYFPYWIDRYKFNNNIDVKNTKDWRYFCQFNNDSSIENHFTNDAIKMYIPLKADYIYDSANQIFDFLSKENIVHSSKIGSKVRMDDLVIRVYNLADAQKIQKFIIENEYIKQGLVKPNPFALSDNLIAYASDGLISYNSEVSRHISDYINELKRNNTLGYASIDSFVTYINTKKDLYRTGAGIDELKNIHKNPKKITNAIEVLDLISIALDGNKNIIDYIEHYNKVSNVNNKLEQTENIKKYIAESYKNKIEIFYNAIMTTYEKYGKTQTVKALCLYLTEGNANGFTSSNNARNNISMLTNKDIDEICNKVLEKTLNSEKEVMELINNVVMSKSDTEEIPLVQEIQFNNYLEKSCYDTIMVYGIIQTIEAIRYAIEKNSYNAFTRQNDARKNLKENIAVENINSIIIQTLTTSGYDITCGYPDYINLYMNYMCNMYGIDETPKR